MRLTSWGDVSRLFYAIQQNISYFIENVEIDENVEINGAVEINDDVEINAEVELLNLTVQPKFTLVLNRAEKSMIFYVVICKKKVSFSPTR